MKQPLRLFFFLVFVLAFPLPAVDLEITGRIVDSRDEEPLIGAEIYLKRSDCGTVTNMNGNFRLRCTNIFLNDTLTISFLGYHQEQIPLARFKNKSTVSLTAKTLDLGGEIVISAERIDIIQQEIPHAKNIVEYKEIQRIGSGEITDILKPLPAVRIEGNDLDGRKIQIRGSDPDEVNVYLDGILLNNVRFDNAADLSIIPVESIEQIEVLRGANLAFVGNGAFGGVVNIVTQQNKEKSFQLKGKMGSFDSRYLIGNMNLPLSSNLLLSYFGQANHLAPSIEYFPSEAYSEKTENDAITTAKQNHNINLNYFTGKAQMSARFLGYFFKYDKPFWHSSYNNYLFSTSYKGELLGTRDLNISLSHLYSNDEVSRRPPGGTHYNSSYLSNRFNARIAKKYSYQGGEVQLLTEYFHDDLLNESSIKGESRERKIYHAFLYENRISFSGVASFKDELKDLPILSWETFLGGRADVNANGNKDITHMIGAQLNYNLERIKISPYFNYGKNVKYPTLLENAYITDITDISRTDTVASRLLPEYGNAIEVGMNLNYLPQSSIYRKLDFSLALFTRTVYNRLLRRPFDDLIANIQIGRNVTRGIETSVKFNEVFRYFNLSASFIQLDITDPLVYAYKPKKNLSVNLQFVSALGFYLNSTYFYEGVSLAWYYNQAGRVQTEEIDPFSDADVSVGFTVPVSTVSLDFQFSGNNIFDSSGFRYYYLKKRFLQFSMSVRF